MFKVIILAVLFIKTLLASESIAKLNEFLDPNCGKVWFLKGKYFVS